MRKNSKFCYRHSLHRHWFTWAYAPEQAVYGVVCDNPDAELLQWSAVKRIGKGAVGIFQRQRFALPFLKNVKIMVAPGGGCFYNRNVKLRRPCADKGVL